MAYEVAAGGPVHVAGAESSNTKLVRRLILRGRLKCAAIVLSDSGKQILGRKYDAFTSDSVHSDDFHGTFGRLGTSIDAKVQDIPLHEGMRQRLGLVVRMVHDAVWDRARNGRVAPVRVLSAPCGLGRDILTVATHLRTLDPRPAVSWLGVDLDSTSDVLHEAKRRAGVARVKVTFLRDDLFGFGVQLEDNVEEHGPFHVVNCIGLTPWLDLDGVERVSARFAALMAPGAWLVMDSLALHPHARLGPLLEINARYHSPPAFANAVGSQGFTGMAPHPTANGVVTVWTARRAGL